jgi:hypothetical protein
MPAFDSGSRLGGECCLLASNNQMQLIIFIGWESGVGCDSVRFYDSYQWQGSNIFEMGIMTSAWLAM